MSPLSNRQFTLKRMMGQLTLICVALCLIRLWSQLADDSAVRLLEFEIGREASCALLLCEASIYGVVGTIVGGLFKRARLGAIAGFVVYCARMVLDLVLVRIISTLPIFG